MQKSKKNIVPLQKSPGVGDFKLALLSAMVGFTVLIVSAAVGIFELGLRRYESGNLLGMQG